MAIYIGSQLVKAVYIGSQVVKAIYIGATQVYSAAVEAFSVILEINGATGLVKDDASGALVNARSTISRFYDHENILRTAKANEIVFDGGRRVENLVSHDLTTWTKQIAGTGILPVITSGYADHAGGTNGFRCVFDLNGGVTTSDYSQLQFYDAVVPRDFDTNMVCYVKSSVPGAVNYIYFYNSQLIETKVRVTDEWTPIYSTHTRAFDPIDARIGLRAANWTIDVDTADIIVSGMFVSHNVGTINYYEQSADSVAYFDYNLFFPDVAVWGDSLTASADYSDFVGGLTRSNSIVLGGVSSETSTQIKDRMIADTASYGHLTIIWAGRNNFSSPATVKADIATMVAALTGNYLIVGVVNGDYALEYSGQSDYNIITQLNTDLGVLYGVNFLDIRVSMVAMYDPSISQDVTDNGNDIPPSSLRGDQLHYTAEGYRLAAVFVYQKLKTLGYVKDRGSDLSPAPTMRHEPEATNLLTYSEDVSNAQWVVSGTALATDFETLSLPGVNDYISNQCVSTTDGIASLWLSGSGTINVSLYNGAIHSPVQLTLTAAPTRYSVYQGASGVSLKFMIGRHLLGGTDGNGTATTITISKVQVEEGSRVTSYISTTTVAVTRPADDISIPLSLTNNFVNAQGIVIFRAKPGYNQFANATHYSFVALREGVSGLLFDTTSGTSDVAVFDGTTETRSVVSPSWVNGDSVTFSVIWNATESTQSIAASLDGGLTWNAWTDGTYDGVFTTDTDINLFFTNPNTNHLQNLLIYGELPDGGTIAEAKTWVEANTSGLLGVLQDIATTETLSIDGIGNLTEAV